MALERLALGTHQAKAMAGGFGKGAIDPGLEARRLRHGLVVRDSIAVERRIARPPAKRCRRTDSRNSRRRAAAPGFSAKTRDKTAMPAASARRRLLRRRRPATS